MADINYAQRLLFETSFIYSTIYLTPNFYITIQEARYNMKDLIQKSLGLAAVAVVGLGAIPAAQAATDANALGDAAIVPYYTTKAGFNTGVTITNTSDATQVVKFRLRRASDSADAFDINLVMSPHDMWAGYISDASGKVRVQTSDNTCTVPEADALGGWDIKDLNAEGADEGYIEIIGMGQVNASTNGPNQIAVAIDAKHGSNGEPRNCDNVRSNFLISSAVAGVGPFNISSVGNIDHQTTRGNFVNTVNGNNQVKETTYIDTPDVLNVSYFIRDTASGMEFGDNATHIVGFSQEAMMTNQLRGLATGSYTGGDFPNLDGGVDSNTAGTGKGLYEAIIRPDLGAASVSNDWSFNALNGVSTDWVVTIPGQYLMENPNSPPVPTLFPTVPNTRDIPLIATIALWDREEKSPGATLTPSPFEGPNKTVLNYEVNVIEWGGQSVLGASNPVKIDPAQVGIQPFGWANLSLARKSIDNLPGLVGTPLGYVDGAATTTTATIYELWNPAPVVVGGIVIGNPVSTPTTNPPVIALAAWARTFSDPKINYGRIVGHSRH